MAWKKKAAGEYKWDLDTCLESLGPQCNHQAHNALLEYRSLEQTKKGLTKKEKH